MGLVDHAFDRFSNSSPYAAPLHTAPQRVSPSPKAPSSRASATTAQSIAKASPTEVELRKIDLRQREREMIHERNMTILKAKLELQAQGKLPLDPQDFEISWDLPSLGDTTVGRMQVDDPFGEIDVSDTFGEPERSSTPLYPFP
jgi:hypothetical protein